jgi:hypothetical protein
MTEVFETMRSRQLEYRKHYSSINALSVLWATHFVSLRRASQVSLLATDKDALEKQLDEALSTRIDRWLICSGWAERWAAASATVLKGYAADLAADVTALQKANDVKMIAAIYANRLESLVTSLESDAVGYVDTRLSVDAREQVRAYFPALWVWHRLTKERWDASRMPLRIGRARSDSLDVDHVVSVKLWDSKVIDEILLPEGETKDLLVNSIGNCLLLRKSFNIAKSAKSLRAFMQDVHEFKAGKLNLEEWIELLLLSLSQVDGDTAAPEELLKATRDRGALIESELKDFVRGKLSRVDVEARG